MVVALDERVVLDDWEAGELSVEYDDHEPQEVIEWALEQFAPRPRGDLHQAPGRGDGDPGHGLADSSDVRVFTVDAAACHKETYA